MTNSLYNRLAKNFKKLAPWAKQHHYTAYRLYDKDIPEFPYCIDLYGAYAVVFEQGARIDTHDPIRLKHLEEIKLAISQLLRVTNNQIIFKERKKDRGGSQYKKNQQLALKEIVHEGSLSFETNLTEYIDTGLFLDHRPLREYLTRLPAHNTLNLFCYTGSLSVASAKAGSKVTSVDLSQTYLDWSKRNFILNHIPPTQHEFINQDCFQAIQEMIKLRRVFDVIIFDPPTFSNSKKTTQDFKVEEDYLPYLRALKKLLKSEGILIFSTNKRKFKLSDEVKDLFTVQDWTKESIPIDFRQKIHQCYFLKHK